MKDFIQVRQPDGSLVEKKISELKYPLTNAEMEAMLERIRADLEPREVPDRIIKMFLPCSSTREELEEKARKYTENLDKYIAQISSNVSAMSMAADIADTLERATRREERFGFGRSYKFENEFGSWSR